MRVSNVYKKQPSPVSASAGDLGSSGLRVWHRIRAQSMVAAMVNVVAVIAVLRFLSEAQSIEAALANRGASSGKWAGST